MLYGRPYSLVLFTVLFLMLLVGPLMWILKNVLNLLYEILVEDCGNGRGVLLSAKAFPGV